MPIKRNREIPAYKRVGFRDVGHQEEDRNFIYENLYAYDMSRTRGSMWALVMIS
jgi:hypothetical protein